MNVHMENTVIKSPPVIAIVGRPNVGKSTLFNRLTGSRAALVDNQPGVTRDRIYGRFDWLGMEWAVVDTGGFDPAPGEDIMAAMRRQTEFGINESDAVLLLMDGKEGLSPADREVADILRRQDKPVICAVNKVDVPSHEERVYEFYELGFEPVFGVSATHGHGIDDLLDHLVERLPGIPEEFESTEDSIPRIAVIGRPNAGKSTLVNALLGEERHLVHESPGTTRDSIDSLVVMSSRPYLFVDTAGMRRKSRIDDRLERYATMRALKSMERCHLALLMIDSTEGIVDQDAKLAGLAVDRGRAVMIVFSKWDLVEDKEARRRELEEQVADRLPHAAFAPVLTVSSFEGRRLGRLPVLIREVLDEYNKRIGTGELNRRFEQWIEANPPPLGHAPLKLFYMSQTGVRPPTFVVFVNEPKRVKEAYKRYLANRIRETYGFPGCPLRLFFRARKKKSR